MKCIKIQGSNGKEQKEQCPDKSWFRWGNHGEERGDSINGKRFIADKSCSGSMEKSATLSSEKFMSRAKFSSPINSDRLIRGLLSPLI